MDSLTLAQKLARILPQIVPGKPEALSELRELYTYDVVFRDPIQEVHGLSDFIAMNERLVGKMRTMEWIILGTWGDDASGTVEWQLRGKPKFGPEVAVDGMTRYKGRDGKVAEHRDYWDLGELAASAIPGGQKLLFALMKPFA